MGMDFKTLSDYFAKKKEEESKPKPLVSNTEASKFAKGLLGYDPKEDEEEKETQKN